MPFSAYAAARGCDAQLNAWCDASCPHRATYGPLLARFDVTERTRVPAWRCYARHTLTEDVQSFAGGSEFCTRHDKLLQLLESCAGGAGMPAGVAVDAAGGARPVQAEPARAKRPEVPARSAPPQPSQPRSSPPRPPYRAGEDAEWIAVPRYRMAKPTAPQYEHSASLLSLPEGVRVPRREDCGDLAAEAPFWAASLYTSSYAHKAQRLHASCVAWAVCCTTSLMPDGAIEGLEEGQYRKRYRLIAMKPLFILRTLQASDTPLVWLDVDLEFHAWPSLFTPTGWEAHPPRDVLLWNWQARPLRPLT
jgi:hypothetical protein